MSKSGYSLRETFLSAEMESVYSTAPADWANRLVSYQGDSLAESCPSTEIQSEYSVSPTDKANRFVLYTGYSLGECCPTAEMPSVYSTAPDWYRIRTLVGGALPLCRGAVGVFCFSNRLSYLNKES